MLKKLRRMLGLGISLVYNEKENQWRVGKSKRSDEDDDSMDFYSPKSVYVGNLKHGKPHGYGILFYCPPPFGSFMEYHGWWKDGRFHGKGKQTNMYSSHSYKYSGFYKDGLPHGFGHESSLFGDYRGWYENGERRGGAEA
jgi:hypothetical protein